MTEEWPLSKEVTLEVLIDVSVLSGLPDEKFCDLVELLCAEAIFRFASAPEGRCGLCLGPAVPRAHLCRRHLELLTRALEVVTPIDREATSRSPAE